MKKIVLWIGIVATLICIKPVKALTFNEDSVTTASGFTMTYEQYKKLSERYDNSFIDYTKSEYLEILTSEKSKFLGEVKKYIVTDYVMDQNGNVLSAFDREVSKEVAEQVSLSNQISTFGNTGNPTHSTASKILILGTTLDQNGRYFTTLETHWQTTPIVKSYDVSAIRWSGDIGVIEATGLQMCEKPVEYSYNGSNMVNKSNGIGISMNLVDNGTTPKLFLYMLSKRNAGTYYGTYQHAVRNVTLAQSKSYSFSSSGLGGVLKFSGSIGSYYDDMQGVKFTY